MIPPDLISRLHRAHSNAMHKEYTLARFQIHGTQRQYDAALKSRDHAERRFDAAVVAIAESAMKARTGACNARKK